VAQAFQLGDSLRLDTEEGRVPRLVPRPTTTALNPSAAQGRFRLGDSLGIEKGEEGIKAITGINRGMFFFGIGFNEGMANIIGLPVDTVNAVFDFMGLPHFTNPSGVEKIFQGALKPFGGSKSIKEGLAQLRDHL